MSLHSVKGLFICCKQSIYRFLVLENEINHYYIYIYIVIKIQENKVLHVLLQQVYTVILTRHALSFQGRSPKN